MSILSPLTAIGPMSILSPLTAVGPMSILSPLTAVVSAVVPLGGGVLAAA